MTSATKFAIPGQWDAKMCSDGKRRYVLRNRLADRIASTHGPAMNEPIRYSMAEAQGGELNTFLQQIVAAICELPAWKFLETMMEQSQSAGDTTGVEGQAPADDLTATGPAPVSAQPPEPLRHSKPLELNLPPLLGDTAFSVPRSGGASHRLREVEQAKRNCIRLQKRGEHVDFEHELNQVIRHQKFDPVAPVIQRYERTYLNASEAAQLRAERLRYQKLHPAPAFTTAGKSREQLCKEATRRSLEKQSRGEYVNYTRELELLGVS